MNEIAKTAVGGIEPPSPRLTVIIIISNNDNNNITLRANVIDFAVLQITFNQSHMTN